MRDSRLFLAHMAFALLVAPALLQAEEEPFFLDIQSRIHTVNGPSVAAEVEMTFRITDRPNGRDALWSQGPMKVPLQDGYFRVTLGDSESPLTMSLFDGNRWLELDCAGCVGRRKFPIHLRGRAVAVEGLERPSAPGPAAAKPWLRNKRLHDQRAYPTGIVPAGRIAEAYQQAQLDPYAIQPEPGIEVAPGSLTEGLWTEIGPEKVTAGQTSGSPRGDVSGRVNSVEVHPTDPNIAYACGAQGGLWKTVDGGASWVALTESLPSLATGAVVLSPSDPNVIYLGTGEANLSLDSYWGSGIFKSTDAGASFASTGPIDPNRAPINSAAIAAMAAHPTDPDIALAAAGTFLEGNLLFSGGVYRTDDGGVSWTRVLGAGLSGSAVASDVKYDPSDANIVYAALGWIGGSSANGMYKSTDGGLNFSMLGGGFPTTNVGRINFAISESNHLILYAAVHNISTNGLLGIYKSVDGGATWTKPAATLASCGAQCWYDMTIAVKPTDPNQVFFGGVSLYRSLNGAINFANISTSSGSTGGIHVDQHALTFTPSNPSQLWSGNDGGVWKTDNASLTSPNWQNLNGNLALLQFQSVAVPPADPNIAYGGTQDNGTNKYTGSNIWSHVDDGDGGQTAVDFVTPLTVYHTFFGVSFRRSDNGGTTWLTKQTGLGTGDPSLFYVPVEMDPTNAAVLYLGTYRLFRTVNRADSWSAISTDLTVDPLDPNNFGEISAIGVSKSNGNVIYVGSSNAQIQVTTNLGGAWTHRASPPLPDRYVSSIAVHPADANTAYVAYSGFGDLSSGFGHVFKTTNLGVSWSDVSADLPDIPVSQVTIDPAAPQMVYLATDIGPYVSTTGGQRWRRYAGGYPNVAAFEIAVQQPNLLFAATHGRGMFQAFGCTGDGTTDADVDDVADFCDNCLGGANASQADADFDTIGPPCDCDDAHDDAFPGAVQVCDGYNNDCNDPTWPAVSPDECFEITNLVAANASGQTVLDWDLPPGGATGYRVYSGNRADLDVGLNGGACVTTVATNSASFSDTPPVGEMSYYIVAGVRSGLEGSRGQDFAGTEREHSNVCP